MLTDADNPSDHDARPRRQRSLRTGWLIAGGVSLLAGIYVYSTNRQEPVPESTLSEPNPAAATLPADVTPRPGKRDNIPRITDSTAVDDSPTSTTRPATPSLPPYERANEFLKTQLETAQWRTLNLDKNLLPTIGDDHFLERCIAFLDGLSRGEVIAKLLPFPRPNTPFISSNQRKPLLMGDENFQRYQPLIKNITAIDANRAADFFHWTRPLLEMAYGGLGYPAENLDRALLSAIDLLLDTPVFETPLALKHESVLFQYADPAIEALPGAQKQLIRIGPSNSATLKEWLTELRSALVSLPANP